MKKILIIEDDVNILYGLQSQLSVKGYDTAVHSGNEEIGAIMAKARIGLPDYLLLDIILPGLDGFDILKAFKNDSELNKCKVFIFTNLSDSETKARGLDLGAELVFLKNEVRIDEIVDKIDKIIKNNINYEKIKKKTP